jgi:hypothetical protein
VVWLAVALGFVASGWFIDDGDHWYGFLGFACIPGIVGLVYLAMAAINASLSKKRGVEA